MFFVLFYNYLFEVKISVADERFFSTWKSVLYIDSYMWVAPILSYPIYRVIIDDHHRRLNLTIYRKVSNKEGKRSTKIIIAAG